MGQAYGETGPTAVTLLPPEHFYPPVFGGLDETLSTLLPVFRRRLKLELLKRSVGGPEALHRPCARHLSFCDV